MSPILGIDLGTTNTVVAVADGTEVRALADAMGRRLVPSTVSFHPDGSILVGHEARDRRLVDATNTVFSTKRLIGRPFTSVEVKKSAERLPFVLEPTPTGGVQVRVRRGTYTLPEISAFILRHVRTMAEEALGVPCRRAVITVPANFNELQRSATQAAAKIAGLEVIRMINEPTAATLAYGLGKEGAERVLVYDLGGGTFDVTVLDLDREALEVVSTAGDTFLGGDDFDLLLAERMSDACLRQHRFDPRSDVQTFERLRAAAEWAKCQLSVVPEVELAVEELFHEAGGRPVNFVFHAKRQDFEQSIRPLIARTFDVVNDALRACGRRPREIDTVVLVGGSTRIPLVMQMVGEFFSRPPRFERDPDLVVAQGAALQAWTLQGRTEASKPAVRVPGRPLPSPAVRPKDVLPRQPAFAPPEQDLPEEPTRIRTDAGIGSGPKSPGAPASRGDKPRTATSPGLDASSGAALGRVQLKSRADDRQARAIETPDAAPPPSRGRPSAPGVTSREPTLRTKADGPRPPAPRDQPAVAVVRPVNVGARPVTGRHPSLVELDDVEAAPEPSNAAPLPAPEADKRWRKATLAGAKDPVPAVGKLAADAPFDLSSASFELTPEKLAEVERAFDDEATQVGAIPRPANKATDETPRPGEVARAVEASRPQAARRPQDTAALGEIAAPPSPPLPAAPLPAAALPAAPSPAAALPAAPLPAPSPAPQARPAPQPPPSRAKPPARDISSWTPEPPSSPAIALPLAPAPPSLPQFSPSPLSNQVAGIPHQPAIPMSRERAPLLMDVTPLALGIETVGGFCQHVVGRNAPVPTEKSRVFATGKDDQTTVEIKICQGDSNVYGDNESLGVIILDALRRAKRGDVRIEVTFMLDPSGVLEVRATDLDTKRVQNTRIQLRGGLMASEVDALKRRQEHELGGRA
jgi:molecular chaperone DnaK